MQVGIKLPHSNIPADAPALVRAVWRQRWLPAWLATIAVLLASAATAQTSASPTREAGQVSAAQNVALTSPACRAIEPFYWEIGDANSVLAAGSVGEGAPSRETSMKIASASKWLYGAYVAQRRNGTLTDEDVNFLTFRSGYTRFRLCASGKTVRGCLDQLLNGSGKQDPATVGRFFYSGGHMQKHADLMGFGALDNDALASAINQEMASAGVSLNVRYAQPQLAGGAVTSAGDYAGFLQGVLKGELHMRELLGTHAVCTNPQTCPTDALKTPIPRNETWHYSIAHWVEDDPTAGDGAFSSPGAFGFYPWISRDKRFYGIVAREEHKGVLVADGSDKPAVQSVYCGRLIRAAWMKGAAPQ